jgi:hypothetical protein
MGASCIPRSINVIASWISCGKDFSVLVPKELEEVVPTITPVTRDIVASIITYVRNRALLIHFAFLNMIHLFDEKPVGYSTAF